MSKPGDVRAKAAKIRTGGQLKQQRSNAQQTKKRRPPMTPEEIEQQQQRFMDISDAEMIETIKFASKSITSYLKDHDYGTMNGLFDVKEIFAHSIEAIWEGRWRWHKNWKLSTQLVQVAKSRISHIIRDNPHGDGELLTCDMTPGQLKELDETEDQLDTENDLRKESIEKAKNILRDYPQYILYLKALEESNCYELIAKKMNMKEVKEVKKLERKMLKILVEKLHGRSAKNRRTEYENY